MVSNREIRRKLQALRLRNSGVPEKLINSIDTPHNSSDKPLNVSYYDFYRCPKCHTMNEVTNNFCKKCGIHLMEPSASNSIEERRVKNIRSNLMRDTNCFELIRKLASYHRNKSSYPVLGFSNLENCLESNNIKISTRDLINLVNYEEDLLPKLTSPTKPKLTCSTKIQDLNKLDGYQFENFLKSLFKNMGYKVSHTPLSGDQGADLIIEKFGEKTAVQAKRYQGSVSNKAVQEVVASIAHYNVNRGMVVTNSDFTRSAIELATSNSVELVDKNKLKNWLEQYPVDNNTKFE
ncbi:MAG: Restriction endonuclease [Candidatus Methanofastidiosum methylothiophilum]|uniref:Restriction endonuclease n=1 Tax=Candidatus Methanofastidiosum methylothiophilum TaxID=1705564 RepID=A0A150IVL2_9EURY|nr:MAG: Restriction endonuclease [Candidatus Methanofastidiosum methylthiophilus]OPX57167.1 MAG: Restriction endonuclease [Methanobacterium sp. PtaB.Bin024]